MDIFIEPIGRLVNEFSKLPGVGKKTAQRYAYKIIDMDDSEVEEFVGAVLGVGNVRIHGCEITLDISFIGDMYGHTGSVIGMERTPEGITLASMYDSIVKGKLYIKNSRGYDWGEVGQGYFYDPETREILDVESCNEINVQKTKE